MLILLCFVVFLIRLFWLFYFKRSYHIGFLVPFFLEIIFVYPYLLMDTLGLHWSYLGFVLNYTIVAAVQIGAATNVILPKKDVFFVPAKHSNMMLTALIVFSFVGVVSNLPGQILFPSNLDSLFALSHSNAVARYDGTLKVSTIYKVSSIFAYFTTFLMGMIYASTRSKKTLFLILLHFGVILMDSVVMAARAGMMLQLFCFLASFYAFSYYNSSRKYYRVTFKKILLSLTFVCLIFLFFVIIQVVRGGKTEYDITGIVSHVITWFVGYIPGFDYWINYLYDYDVTYGQRTFVGLFDLLGISERVSGVYPAIDIGNGRISNIFTAYRGLVEDFTMPGLYLALFILGFLLSYIPNVVVARGAKFLAPITSFIVFFFFWSYVINPFSYNVIFFAALMFWAYFVMFVRMKSCD
ncbi:TPA: O-antigen polymerase [Enterobacter mori]